MKKFKFKLEAVLRYRKYKERLAQLELVKIKNAVIQKQLVIKKLSTDRRLVTIKLKEKEDEGITMGQFRIYTMYIEGLEIKIEEETKELNRLIQKMRRQQEVVKQERIKKKSLERMEEIAQQTYIQTMIKAEQKLMDEIAGLKRKTEKEETSHA